MRTTIRLDEHLLSDVKKHALDNGQTLTAVIEEALREKLVRQRAEPRARRLRLPTFKGTGLHPGVDLDDAASLLNVMES